MEDSNRLLTCVLFPGVVKNEDRAIQCLGGIRAISQVYSNPNKKRLGLSFQPENPFMKRIYADATNSAGVLLRVRVKKTKQGNEVKREVISTAVVGRVKTLFVFQSMCDFQYLPVQKEGTAGQQCMLKNLLPSGLDDMDYFSQPAPVFITPPKFTRFDKPTNYCYTDKRYLTERKIDGADDQVHHIARMDRGLPSARFNFNLVIDFPTEPHECHLSAKAEKVKVMPELQQEFEAVKKMFEERPIWSSSLIRYHAKIRIMSSKFIMPCLSYYLMTGPWRNTWVRYGYDPRKEPGARLYQTLDFRLRTSAGLQSLVSSRDHYKKSDRVNHIKKKKKRGEEEPAAEVVHENTVYFRPGMAPGQRQIFYQYCDVKLPEIEEILRPEPPPGALCHPKRGWLPPGANEAARDAILEYTKNYFAAQNSDMKVEQGSSDDESSGDEGASSSAMDIDETSNT